jgi:hypothetical protein
MLRYTALEDDLVLGLKYIQHCGAWHVVAGPGRHTSPLTASMLCD